LKYDQTGTLPAEGYLANTYVPMQQPGDLYPIAKAFACGTLFPGLDLPFKNMVNEEKPLNTPEMELMSLSFAVHELGLYLDIHPQDKKALEYFNHYTAQLDVVKAKYEQKYGPLTMQTRQPKGYVWAAEPWPWDCDDNHRKGGK